LQTFFIKNSIKNMKLKSLLFAFALALPFLSQAQLSEPSENWQHLDKLQDGVMGVSTDKMYQDLLKGKKSTPVVVAVIDGGVDPLHEDLKDVMWKNPGEIPGNGIDDDGNGYADDVYGWNFIGGKNGENVHHDQLEITRLYVVLDAKYKNADPSKLSKKEKKEYEQYKEFEKTITEKREESAANASLYGSMLEAIESVVKAIGKEDIQPEDLDEFKSDDPKVARSAQIMKSMLSQGGTVDELKGQIQEAVDYFKGQAEYNYNPDLKVRHIVGDNYADSYQRYYGNNDVKGPDASHGTHVAGIIGAKRGNDVGMDGIADNVKIMAVRCVPDGDERDKDVANSIIYAVDNGASVINMSFGKGYSWDKKAVDKAVKYAKKHDVLLVHAAGNSHQNNDNTDNFPNDKYEKRGLFGPKYAKNWIEVGALSWKDGEDMAATFSNYGKEGVDLFAPGVDIYSTFPDNEYNAISGTSMASPVVAGVAALIRSYYPDLTAEQVKDVLMSSTVMTKDAKVKLPGGEGKIVPFSDLCVTGGAVNAYEAVKAASKVKGKKKNSKSKGGRAGNGTDAKPEKKGRA
jgi:cell wall-associated protease